MKAIWNGRLIAQSSDTIVVEGNHYFPRSSLNKQYFIASETTSHCPWKGDAAYYTVVVDGRQNKDAAWYYPSPKEAASNIRGRVAFGRGVQVVE